MRVDTLATVDARVLDALLDVLGARRTLESLRANTLDMSVWGQCASASVATRRRRAEILFVAIFSRITGGAQARVLAQGLQLAGTAIVARRRIARVLYRNFTQTLGEPDRTTTRKRRSAIAGRHLASAPVLTPRARPDVARIWIFTKFTGISRRTIAVG